jgi:4,5:9,10-diseco-3-hydroxy-5,9,17-trioxoandrosta-1(10),2-diene-4-oate hydrolase
LDASQLESKTVLVNGVRISYVEAGEGPGDPILLLHGGGPGAGGLSNFSRNIIPLSKRLGRVIAPDMPGFGNSENKLGDEPGLFRLLSDVLLGFMDAMNIARADMVGNSLGGGMALYIALHSPERVRRLVMMGPGGALYPYSPFPTEGIMRLITFYQGDGPTPEKMRGVLEHLVFDQSVITPELIEQRTKAATRPDVVANWPTRGRMLENLWQEPGLSTLPHETLVIWGREDKMNPVDGAILFGKVIPKAQVHLFPNCGHWAQWEKAAAFNDLVASFLSL